jgi:hypothetical protein
MRGISSGWTFFYKRVFPIIWFGFLVVFVGIGVAHGQGAFVVIAPIAMIGSGYFIMQKLVFDLVDEVWDDGDALVVKNRGQEQRLALSEVKNVNYSPFINPPRVTLSLRRPTVFGEQIILANVRAPAAARGRRAGRGCGSESSACRDRGDGRC